jgi:PilZ domain
MGRINHDQERRNARRFQVSWEVNVRGTDQTGGGFDEAGTLENLSSLGAFLYLPSLVNLGERLEVQIKVPFRSNWVKYAAQVVRLEQESAEAGVALKFDTAVPVFLLAR